MRQIVNNTEASENHISLDILINKPLKKLDKSDQDYDKKALEICHVGKFLQLLHSEYQISDVREQPDFIIKSVDNLLIGLEHEILVDSVHKKIEGSFADIIKSAEDEFRKRHPETKLLANIYVNTDKNISKRDKPVYIEKLVSIMENYIFHNRLEENDLVESITVGKHSRLGFYCNTGIWSQQSLHSDLVTESIHKKEQKRLDYIRESKTEEQWLLIVIGSAGQSSYEIDSLFDESFTFNSGFNRIFLMEDFSGRLFEL